ncbi:MAG TPA: mandelate racemase/muconate lactonizing enzyme family protein [Actinospica sp.]|jgi:galactonate dehydratase|nr:mandelate racemase/muconate lactonizing enzyme family protein [Actinospica sp.]
MKISSITCHPVRVGSRPLLLVRVRTDDGLVGWGESGLSGRELAVIGAVEHFTSFLLGRDPMNPGALWQEMYRSQYFEGGRVLTAAISAIDIALYDIVGKALGVPVYQLLGGRHRTTVPTFATAHTLDAALHLKASGWDCIRLERRNGATAPGVFEPWQSIPATVDWLVEAREALGTGVVLGIDYHHRLSVAEAAAFSRRLPDGTLDFLEEPIRDETPDAYRVLRGMCTIPFAIGEEFASKWQFLPYLEQGLTQFARIDVCNVGGFTEAMKVAGWSEAHYVDLMPHNPLGPVCTAATIHLAAAVPNFSWLECRETPGEDPAQFESPLFVDRPRLAGTGYPVPTAPGLGIDVDESLLAEFATADWFEPPHLRRTDGSYTNW